MVRNFVKIEICPDSKVFSDFIGKWNEFNQNLNYLKRMLNKWSEYLKENNEMMINLILFSVRLIEKSVVSQ